MAVRVFAGAHGCDESGAGPIFHDIEVGPDRSELAGDAAVQVSAVTFAAVAVGQDIFAVLHCRPLGGRSDGTGEYRLAERKLARTEQQQTQKVESGWPSAGR